jgi:hypothetical protein
MTRTASSPGLPDDLFSNKKSKFGLILEGLGMEKVGTYMYSLAIGIYYDHLVI